MGELSDHRKRRALEGHEFWSDDLSLLDTGIVEPFRLLNAAHITDTYLLSLARAKGGQLATLDHRLLTSAVRGGPAGLRLIEGVSGYS
jgi:predicted nucleic acid-binding protein